VSGWLITAVERTDPAAVRAVRDILETYHDELVDEIGATSLTAELTTLPAPYVRPDGALLLARDADGRPGGCVGVRGLSATECEIKRLYVLREARGAGLGRALVRAAIDQARAMGYAEMLLTAVKSTTIGAQRLYRQFGFEQTAQYGPVSCGHDSAALLFMRRRL